MLHNRPQILGELLGLVIRWRDAGQPLGARPHRCDRWAQIIGGILQVAGLPEFLANQEDAIADLDEDFQDLISLAERAISQSKPGFCTTAGGEGTAPAIGKRATEWVPLFRDAKVQTAAMQSAAHERHQATVAGTFLSARLNRPLPILVGNRAGTAIFRGQPARSNGRLYWLEVAWAEPTPVTGGNVPPPVPASDAPGSTARGGTGGAAGHTQPPGQTPTATTTAHYDAVANSSAAPSGGPNAMTPSDTTATTTTTTKSGNDLDWDEA